MKRVYVTDPDSLFFHDCMHLQVNPGQICLGKMGKQIQNIHKSIIFETTTYEPLDVTVGVCSK